MDQNIKQPNHNNIYYKGVAANHDTLNTTSDAVGAPDFENLHIESMLQEDQWTQLAFLQDFNQNNAEIAEPAINQLPLINIAVDNIQPVILPEPPAAANTEDYPIENVQHAVVIPEPPAAANNESYRNHNLNTKGQRYICQDCSYSTNSKRDFYRRHLKTRKHERNVSRGGGHNVVPESNTTTTGFHCPVSGCKFDANGKTFTRKDNVWRHILKMHDIERKQG